MILTANIGNSHITFGCEEDGTVVFVDRTSTDLKKTDLEYAITFTRSLEAHHIALSEIRGVVLSCVVPSILGIIRQAVKRLFNFDPYVVSIDSAFNMTTALDKPSELGGNLIAASVGAIETYGSPVIIIDMGTATSIGVIDRNHRYLGGVILPGLQASVNALAGGAALLPEIELTGTDKPFGRNTIEAINSGVIYGNAGMIDRILSEILASQSPEFRHDVKIIATGHLSNMLMPFVHYPVQLDEHLLVKGLALIYHHFQEVQA